MGNSPIICPASLTPEPSQPSRATLGSRSQEQSAGWEGQMWWREGELDDSLLPNVRKLQRYDRDRLVSTILGRKEVAHGQYYHQHSEKQDEDLHSNKAVGLQPAQESKDKSILQSLERKYQQMVESRLQMKHKVQAEHHAKRQKSTKEYRFVVSHKQPEDTFLKI